MAEGLDIRLKVHSRTSESEIGPIERALAVVLSGDDFIHAKQTIGTSEEAVAIGDVTIGGYILVVNLDTTNYVELRPGSGVADLVKLSANGGVALFQTASDCTLYAIANTSSCQIEYWLWDA